MKTYTIFLTIVITGIYTVLTAANPLPYNGKTAAEKDIDIDDCPIISGFVKTLDFNLNPNQEASLAAYLGDYCWQKLKKNFFYDKPVTSYKRDTYSAENSPEDQNPESETQARTFDQIKEMTSTHFYQKHLLMTGQLRPSRPSKPPPSYDYDDYDYDNYSFDDVPGNSGSSSSTSSRYPSSDPFIVTQGSSVQVQQETTADGNRKLLILCPGPAREPYHSRSHPIQPRHHGFLGGAGGNPGFAGSRRVQQNPPRRRGPNRRRNRKPVEIQVQCLYPGEEPQRALTPFNADNLELDQDFQKASRACHNARHFDRCVEEYVGIQKAKTITGSKPHQGRGDGNQRRTGSDRSPQSPVGNDPMIPRIPPTWNLDPIFYGRDGSGTDSRIIRFCGSQQDDMEQITCVQELLKHKVIHNL